MLSFLVFPPLNHPLQNATLSTELSLVNQPSQATTDCQTTSVPMDDIKRTQPNESSSPEMPDTDTAIVCWECTTCGRRYVDISEMGFFIPPPPSTECLKAQIDQTGTPTSGRLTKLSVASGSTCEYMRINRNAGDSDLGEQISEREGDYYPMAETAQRGVSVQPWDANPIKAQGELGRQGRSYGRSNRGVDIACDDPDLEDCEFWKAECKDVDCIYKGSHCRYQCAMAESDEESEKPEIKVAAPGGVLSLWRSAVKRAY